ncbi:hypothetical protein [Solidesulfovibrio magneticus]|uniref:Uncharacterized protein n=1 Tax=Solidesulfovibrio magneticus (strain ATCC 700980 / DSM 13731 / RS-1) TaxID=573370 RepID=C4XGM4_SOLM1|nr:hypothetical protein [Solidesulfovibrio magneticus]BAH73804.1 hypothetical protein DMR_03130 [Solidesulfovibrio magneticus RS-1]
MKKHCHINRYMYNVFGITLCCLAGVVCITSLSLAQDAKQLSVFCQNTSLSDCLKIFTKESQIEVQLVGISSSNMVRINIQSNSQIDILNRILEAAKVESYAITIDQAKQRAVINGIGVQANAPISASQPSDLTSINSAKNTPQQAQAANAFPEIDPAQTAADALTAKAPPNLDEVIEFPNEENVTVRELLLRRDQIELLTPKPHDIAFQGDDGQPVTFGDLRKQQHEADAVTSADRVIELPDGTTLTHEQMRADLIEANKTLADKSASVADSKSEADSATSQSTTSSTLRSSMKSSPSGTEKLDTPK